MDDKKMHASIYNYLKWPLYLYPFFIAMNIHLYVIDLLSGVIVSGYLFLYLVIIGCIFLYKRNSLLRSLVYFANGIQKSNESFYYNFSYPVAIINSSGKFLWKNKLFQEIFSTDQKRPKNIFSWIPTLHKSSLPITEKETEAHFRFNTRYYKISMCRIELGNHIREKSYYFGTEESVVILSIYDETELICYMNENKAQQLAVGLLYIDNYEESLETTDEDQRSLFSSMIDRKINNYMATIDAITKKLEKDKYIFLFQHKYLAELQNKKFTILDEIREISEEVDITVSIGIGVQADSFKKRNEYARIAIDLALGRGGDQAVVKAPENVLYYGGKNTHLEKNTRVKARVKAHALKESIEAAEQIIIMGHKIPDVDSLGAAIGIYRIAKTLGKNVHIVINHVTSSLKPLLQLFLDNPEYEEDLFISGDKAEFMINTKHLKHVVPHQLMGTQAEDMVNSGTLLVIVDTNNPSNTDSPNLLELTNSIVILDHHRMAGEFIKNPILSYVEPFASSSSEMVAEILQYVGEEIKLRPNEANALYSGIMIDTNRFIDKTGIRTFEAVAYLRRQGADITKIRKMFRTDMEDYKVRAEAINNTEILMDDFAMTFCNADGLDSPTIIGAKISDELLNINDIKASFVLTAWDNKVYISARSIDELNVQLVMERLGGGGHATCAGAQLENYTPEEASELLYNTLNKMKEEGDLI
ncbi:MAG: DHH family phosphoesterase [Lachnoclostridium sp.]|nr:DHH family phosphoesterase [Lachnoclostridium sp.]